MPETFEGYKAAIKAHQIISQNTITDKLNKILVLFVGWVRLAVRVVSFPCDNYYRGKIRIDEEGAQRQFYHTLQVTRQHYAPAAKSMVALNACDMVMTRPDVLGGSRLISLASGGANAWCRIFKRLGTAKYFFMKYVAKAKLVEATCLEQKRSAILRKRLLFDAGDELERP